MSLPIAGWKNKGGTSMRSCKCGSWKDHWINGSGKSWPTNYYVAACKGAAEVGAHIYNPAADGEWIAPFCTTCNNDTSGVFTLEGGVTLVPANQTKTCAQ